jgi:SAM-dependent methyltransferase
VKPSVSSATVKILRRLVYPSHSWQVLCRLRGHKDVRKALDDPQLKLYSEILPGDFLHYGFFDDVNTTPDLISIRDLQRAQLRYAEELLRHVQDTTAPILDAGCGMGGLIGQMLRAGWHPVALTPNQAQIEYVRSMYPSLPVFHGKLEQLPIEKYGGGFGTVIMSESFQYMKLKQAFFTVLQVLRPGGRWIICDYFRTSENTGRKSAHAWSAFEEALRQVKMKLVFERDITRNVLPTLGYVHMLGERLATPLVNFVIAKLRKKRPAIHYVLEDVIEELRAYMLDQLQIVNPAEFARDKKYMLLVVERA